MSESPTHPDAPRAGGETPNLLVTLETLSQWPDLRECLADLRDQWVEHADANGDCRVLIDAKRAAYLTVIVAHLTELPAALPSLLERHRDGEREFAHMTDERLASAIDFDLMGMGGCETGEERVRIASHLLALCREQVARVSAPPSPERASK